MRLLQISKVKISFSSSMIAIMRLKSKKEMESKLNFLPIFEFDGNNNPQPFVPFYYCFSFFVILSLQLGHNKLPIPYQFIPTFIFYFLYFFMVLLSRDTITTIVVPQHCRMQLQSTLEDIHVDNEITQGKLGQFVTQVQ